MARRRSAVAVACIALVVLAGILPLGGVALDWVVVPATFTLLQPLAPTRSLVEPPRCDARTSGYLGAIESRGPPRPPLA